MRQTTDHTALQARVHAANRSLAERGLVRFAFGNVSEADRAAGVMAIKPSGVPYASLRTEDIVVVRLADGSIVAGERRASSDTPTHLALYRAFPSIGGVVHTHSPVATAWAQAEREIPCLGTTHADHFDGPVPVTRPLTDEEIGGDYEANTGQVIVERFGSAGPDPDRVPGVLVARHGPFTWGVDGLAAVEHADALEYVAAIAFDAVVLDPLIEPVGPALLRRHFDRKHGPSAYYGQPGEPAKG